MAVLSSKSFDIVNQKTRQQKGPIVRVELSPGRFVKMHREDAIAAGYIKAKPAGENKMLPAAEDKALSPDPSPRAEKGTISGGDMAFPSPFGDWADRCPLSPAPRGEGKGEGSGKGVNFWHSLGSLDSSLRWNDVDPEFCRFHL